jgi:hypothetical protein
MQIMGCDFAQGRLIAPPMAKDDFLALLQQRMNKSRAPNATPPTVASDDEQAPPDAASA